MRALASTSLHTQFGNHLNTHHSQVLKRPSFLDILQRFLQILKLHINPALGLLRALHSLRLESLDGLDLAVDIVLLDAVALELLLDVVDDGGVLQDLAVVREVDVLRLLAEHLHAAAGIVIALLEGGERLCGAAFEAELGADSGPVVCEYTCAFRDDDGGVLPIDLEGGAAL